MGLKLSTHLIDTISTVTGGPKVMVDLPKAARDKTRQTPGEAIPGIE